MNLKLLNLLQTIRPNSEYAVGDTFETLKWLDKKQTKPTKTEYDNAVKAYDAKEYSRKRQAEYPAIGEQLDLLFHDMTAGKGTKDGEWYKAVNKVKSDNPKPE